MAGWKAGPFAAFDYFFWIPWLVPHFGGIVGAVIYELMVELHHPEPEETQEFYITKWTKTKLYNPFITPGNKRILLNLIRIRLHK